MNVTNIPNPIDTHVYYQKDKQQSRLHATLPADKRIILFVSQRVTMTRKGIGYFIDALNKLVAQYPEMKDNTMVAVMGSHADEILPLTGLARHSVGLCGQ